MNTISHDLLVGIERRIQEGQIQDFNPPVFDSVTVDALLEFACQFDVYYRGQNAEALSFLKRMGQNYPLLANVSRDLVRRSFGASLKGAEIYEQKDWEWHFLTPAPPLPAPGEIDPFQSARKLVVLNRDNFYQRFKKGMVHYGFDPKVATAITSTFKEMCDNVFQHSGEKEAIPAPGLAAYHVGQGWGLYSVVDTGRGALSSLSTNPKWETLESEIDALRAITNNQASRRAAWANGGGFKQVFKALADYNGILRFRSGDATLRIDGSDTARVGTQKTVPPLPGFFISVRCRLDADTPEYVIPLNKP